jgi:hypothetical protein
VSAAAVDKAFRFFKIDPAKEGATDTLLVAMAQHMEKQGAFARRNRGRPEKLTNELRARIFTSAWLVAKRFEEKHGRKPTLGGVAKGVAKTGKYGGFTVERLRQLLCCPNIRQLKKLGMEDREGVYYRCSATGVPDLARPRRHAKLAEFRPNMRPDFRYFFFLRRAYLNLAELDRGEK